MPPSQMLPCDGLVQDFDTHDSQDLPSQSIFGQLRVAIADLVVKHIVGIGEDLEVSLVGRELRRVVDIRECQPWDPEVSKVRVWHVPALRVTSWTASTYPSLERLQTHFRRHGGMRDECVVTHVEVM